MGPQRASSRAYPDSTPPRLTREPVGTRPHKVSSDDLNRRLRFEDVPEPAPRAGDVKLRVIYTGICGTDVHEFYNGPPALRWLALGAACRLVPLQQSNEPRSLHRKRDHPKTAPMSRRHRPVLHPQAARRRIGVVRVGPG
jgi:hypothetical protein